MSPKEQDRILADLLLEERKLERTIACLESKARQTEEVLSSVLYALKNTHGTDFKKVREQYESVSPTDIRLLIDELEQAVKKLAVVRQEIKNIGGERPYC